MLGLLNAWAGEAGPRLCGASLRAASRPGHGAVSNDPLAFRALLLFRALPDHAGIALQRHQRLAGPGPFLQLLDGDVVERLPPGAAGEQRAGNVDHVRRARALEDNRRAAM